VPDLQKPNSSPSEDAEGIRFLPIRQIGRQKPMMIFDNLVVAVDGIFNDVFDLGTTVSWVGLILKTFLKRRPQISESFGYLWSSY
jgi:hypothetical protein